MLTMKLLRRVLYLLLSVSLSACTLFTDSASEPVWIDVRTVAEYDEDHIDNDLNIPLGSIDIDQFSSMFDKDDEINLYCRSGNRAGQAKNILEAAGFTNVNNMGGIDAVRELRGLP
jgi:phage shock protein E